nr:hypothetical protein [Anaerolineae bacterium]
MHDKIRQERAREEYQSNRRTDPQYGVADWRQIDLQMRQAVKERQSRHRRQKPAMTAKPRRSYRAWGWVWLLVGVIWLVAANYAQISGSLQHWLQSPEATAVLTMVQDWVPENLVEIVSDNAGWLNNWWIQFTASLNSPPNADGPEYAYLFASTVFGLAALPVLFFLLGKVIQRLFS